MSMPDPSGWIPSEIKNRIFDNVVNFIAKQTGKIFGRRAGDAVRKLTSDGSFISKFNIALKNSQERFIHEYNKIDPELTEAISQGVKFWEAESIRQAIMTIVQRPGAWIDDERNIVSQHFTDVFQDRFSKDRVDNAINFFLKCLAQELWHLPELQRAYELQIQQYTASHLQEVTKEIKDLRSDIQNKASILGGEDLLEDGRMPREIKINKPSPKDKLEPSLLSAPPSMPSFIGRKALLDILRQYWLDDSIGAVGVIGWGGIGKSSLSRHWIDQLLISNEISTDGIFWWSFETHNSVDEFLESLLIYLFTDFIDVHYPTSPSVKIRTLIKELNGREITIVLDNVEVMQFDDPHRSSYGRFKSPELREFINYFSDIGRHNSKLLINSQIPLVDIDQYNSFRAIDLEELTSKEGLELLQKLGLRGDEKKKLQIVNDNGGHPLILTLIAGYLHSYADGIVDCISEIPLPLVDNNRYEALHRILHHYDTILSTDEQSFMWLFSAFRSPIQSETISKTFRESDITLARDLSHLSFFDFNDLISRLEKLKLIRANDNHTIYTCHPIIRGYYRMMLAQNPAKSSETYLFLCNYYLHQPIQGTIDTLEKLSSRIDALHYACDAGDYSLAFTIWYQYIQQKRWAIQKQFGALELDIDLIELFMPNGKWDQTPLVSDLKSQAVLINQLGYVLNRLGQTIRAIPLLQRAGMLRIEAEDWDNAACSFFDLAEAKTHLGLLSESIEAANRSVELAKRGPIKRLYSATACLAWVNFLLGNLEVTIENYKVCDSLEEKIKNDRGSVYLADRVHHCAYLIRTGQIEEVKVTIAQNLLMAQMNKWSDEIASCIRQSGDIELIKGNLEEAVKLYTDALEQAKLVGRIDEIVACLLSRANILTIRDQLNDSDDDLVLAANLCLKGQWRLHFADIDLLKAKNCIKRSDYGNAKTLVEEALISSRETGYKWVEIDGKKLLSEIT